MAKEDGEREYVLDDLLLRTEPKPDKVLVYAVKKNIDRLLEGRQQLFSIFLLRPPVSKPPDYKRSENEISVILCISD